MSEYVKTAIDIIGDIIALGSLIVAAAALIYEARVKKYELTYQYYSDVLSWHDQVVEVLIGLRLNAGDRDFVRENLVKLSALIETGRFYFPNLYEKNGFGTDKPAAYRGYRNGVLDPLVHSYGLFERPDCPKHADHALMLQRVFTSYVFEYLKPRKQQKRIYRNTMIKCPKELTTDEFLSQPTAALYRMYQSSVEKDREKSETKA